MFEGYTELAPLVAIFCTNVAVVKKSRRLWLNTSSCSRLAVNALSFFNLNFNLYCVVLWTCQVVVMWTLQNVFVISVANLWLKKHQQNITGFIRKVYYAYIGVKLEVQDKSWAPHKVCYVCVVDLRKWSKWKKKTFRFGVPVIWREPKNHSDDCYFCCWDVKGYSSKNKNLSCTQTFLQLYALLMAQRYLYLSQQKY
jgi:hypothetical protein